MNNNNNTLIDMLYNLKDFIGLHGSSGANLGKVLEKQKIPKLIGLRLIKNIMTNDGGEDEEWKYSLIDKPNELKLYDEIFFNDRITDINKIIIHPPNSQWWKSFGLHSNDVIHVLQSESIFLLKITELLALAGTDGIIVTEFSKLLDIPFKVYHYVIDRLVALDIVTKRMIIPINKYELNVSTSSGHRIKSAINIVHLMRFARFYNPIIHHASIAYDDRTTKTLKNVVQSIFINDKNNEKMKNVKKLHKSLNIRKHEAAAILKVVRSADSDHENDDEKDIEQKGKKEQKIDEFVYPFNSYLRNHTLFEQARLLIAGTPGGVSSQAFRSVLKLDHKKASKLVEKFKMEFKFPTQEKLHHYNHTTFILPFPPKESNEENRKELPDDFKNLSHREVKEKIIMMVMNSPGKGIEVSREMTELSNTIMADVILPFKFDRKQVQKTCQNLHDMKKLVLYELPLPEGILLFKLPTVRIIALPEIFEDKERVNAFMHETIERLKPGAQKGKKKSQIKAAGDGGAVVKVKAKPQRMNKRPAKAKAVKMKIKEESVSDSYESSEESSSEPESIIDEIDESDKASVSSNDDIDDKIDQLFKMTGFDLKRNRDIDSDDDDSDDSEDERQRKRLKKAEGIDDDDDDDERTKQTDEWSLLQEAYALQYHLLNCLQRNLLKKNTTTLLPWNSIIIRNMDTVDLSYIHGRSFTKAQMDNVGKKWPMIKNHLYKLLKTHNTIRKILAFVLSNINQLDPELVELLNGVLDSRTYSEKRHGQVTSLEQAAMSKALRVCAGEKGCLDVINDYSSSIKSRVENELLISQLIRSRPQDLTGNLTNTMTDNSYEISDDKLLSYDRAILHYNLSKSEKIGENILSISEILNVNSGCVGELHLMDYDKKVRTGPVFTIKIKDESLNLENEANAISLLANVKSTRYPELNRLDVNLKVYPNLNTISIPESNVETHHSSNDLFDHYEWLIEVVRAAGNNGVNTIQIMNLLRDKLNKDVDLRALDTIIRRGIEKKSIIQIYDFIEQDLLLEKDKFDITPSLLIDIQFEYLYRVYDGEDGTCPWMNEYGVTNTTLLTKLQANIKALLTNLPGADFKLLHSYFPYLTKYQMEMLLKKFIASGLIRQQNPTTSILINNPFDSISYSIEPCYFLFS